MTNLVDVLIFNMLIKLAKPLAPIKPYMIDLWRCPDVHRR